MDFKMEDIRPSMLVVIDFSKDVIGAHRQSEEVNMAYKGIVIEKMYKSARSVDLEIKMLSPRILRGDYLTLPFSTNAVERGVIKVIGSIKDDKLLKELFC